MHNMKQKTMHIMMTFAFAFLMVATALIPMIGTEDSSAAYTESNPQTVTVHMRVGDTFVYTPSVNIAEGTTTYTLTGGAQDGVSFTDGTLTAAFAEAGTKTVTLKAHWESGTDGEYNNVAQDAYLKLDMIVDERLTVVDETPTKILLVNSTNKAGSDVYTFAKETEWTGPKGASADDVTLAVYSSADDAAKQTNATDGKFVWDAAESKVKVGSEDVALGTYYVRLNLSYDNSYASADTAFSILTVLVTNDFASGEETLRFIEENGDDFRLFRNLIADSANADHTDSWAVRTTLDSKIGTDVEFTSRTIEAVTDKASPAGVIITGSPGTDAATPTFTFDASQITAITGNYAEYQYRITAAGTYGTDSFSESAVVTYHVYASAKFMDVPTVASKLFITSASDNPEDVTVTTTVSNADSITVYWGDGTSSKISTYNADNVSYTARHVYASEANYMISVVAENGNGTTTGTVYCDLQQDLIDFVDNAKTQTKDTFEDAKTQVKDIVTEHGWLFIALIAVGAVISIVSLIWFPDYRFIAIGLILVAVGAVIFFGGWKLP